MRAYFVTISCALLAACGDGGQTAVGPGVGGSSGSAGAGSGGLAAGGTSGAGGSSAGTAGSGGSGQVPGTCGGFGTPELLFLSPDVLSSLSITGDELELFYFVGTRVFVSKRASAAEPFLAAVESTELGTACPSDASPSLDVSVDGLRIYITCYEVPTPLLFAERSDRSSPFVLAEDPVGMTGTSIGIGNDELSAYATTTSADAWQVLVYQRASIAEPFGAGLPLPGITVPFRQTELSGDGRSLFGIVPRDATQMQWSLAVATRPTSSGPFTAPSTAGLPAPLDPPMAFSDYTPTLNGGCTALYFMRLLQPTQSAVYVVRRQ